MPRGGHIRSGPAPLDARVRFLRGSKQRRSSGPAAPPSAAEAGWPDPPRLSRPAAQEWQRLGWLLHAEGRLTKADGPALEIAAQAYALAGQLRRRRMKAKHADDVLRFAAAERNALEQYRKVLNDLCLNAATRGKAPAPRAPAAPSRLERFRELKATVGATKRS